MTATRRTLTAKSSDEELLAAIHERTDPVRRDRAATLLDERHRRPLTAYANRMLHGTGAHGRGEDVVQQVLSEAVRGARIQGDVRGALFMRTRRRAIDELRRARQDRPLDGAHGEAAPPERVVLLHERYATVLAGLHAVGPANRDVIVNQHFLGLSRRDAAERRGVDDGSERTQRHRAVTELRARVLELDPAFFA